MCCVISQAVENGDVLLEGIGTFVPIVGYELARRQHAPDAISFSPSGTVFRHSGIAPLSLESYEADALARAERVVSYGEMAMRYLPAYLPRERPRWKEFMRPAQVDRVGQTNNVVIGSYAAPSIRLPGAVGIPDGAAVIRETHMYCPRHTDRVFVEECDFVSGLGWAPRGPDGRVGNPRFIVTDVAVIEFTPNEAPTLVSVHPGVTVDQVKGKTGFALQTADAGETSPPTRDEIRLLREIDPLGLRRLEFLSARARRQALRQAAAHVEVPQLATSA